MTLLRQRFTAGIRRILLLSVGTLCGIGISLAQEGRSDHANLSFPQDTTRRFSLGEVFRYPDRTLWPESSGQTVSFAGRTEMPSRFAIKTNLAYLATLTPNLAFETAVGKRFSLEVGGGYHPWKEEVTVIPEGGDESTSIVVDGKRLEHWLVKPELRYWLRAPFSGHFFGVNALYSEYDLGGYDIPWLFDKEFFYDGKAYGGSLVYGYHWAFSRRWRAEFNVGLGVIQLDYDKRECQDDYCDAEPLRFKKTYLGPTQVGIRLVFMIK